MLAIDKRVRSARDARPLFSGDGPAARTDVIMASATSSRCVSRLCPTSSAISTGWWDSEVTASAAGDVSTVAPFISNLSNPRMSVREISAGLSGCSEGCFGFAGENIELRDVLFSGVVRMCAERP